MQLLQTKQPVDPFTCRVKVHAYASRIMEKVHPTYLMHNFTLSPIATFILSVYSFRKSKTEEGLRQKPTMDTGVRHSPMAVKRMGHSGIFVGRKTVLLLQSSHRFTESVSGFVLKNWLLMTPYRPIIICFLLDCSTVAELSLF